MGEPVGPTTQAPPPASVPAFFPLSKKALEASRMDILVLASGILFLASPVCLLVWVLCRSGGSTTATQHKEDRKVSIVLPNETEPSPPPTADAQDDRANATALSAINGDEDSLVRLRRSSTWSGRSAHPGSRTRGRRKSAGSRWVAQDSGDKSIEEDEDGKQGAQTSLSSPGPEPEPEPGPEGGHAALSALGDMGRMASTLATPAALLLPSGGSESIGNAVGDNNDGGAEDMELSEFDPRRASIEKPPSPRSPRVLAADQAAMMDALCAEEGDEGDWKAAVPSPDGVVGRDSLDLASGFDDPLGVNKLVDLPPKDEEGPEEFEMESRGEQRL